MLQAACWGKTTVNFSELEVGEYPVNSFHLIENGRYGPAIKADLGDKVIFLPQRFVAEHTQESIRSLNTLPHIMVFGGMETNSRGRSM